MICKFAVDNNLNFITMKTARFFKHVLGMLTVLLSMWLTGCQNQLEEVAPEKASATSSSLMSRSSDSELPFLQGADPISMSFKMAVSNTPKMAIPLIHII